MFPAVWFCLFDCSSHKRLAVLSCIPFNLLGKRLIFLASVSMDWQVSQNTFCLSKVAFIFVSLLFSALSFLEVVGNCLPLKPLLPHQMQLPLCCVCQLYSLQANGNRARIIHFSNFSHTSHTAWVSPAPVIPWNLSPSKHQDCRHQKGLTKASGSVLQRWGIQHLQIFRTSTSQTL